MSRPAPKRAGERVEGLCVDRLPTLRNVPDSEAQHYDAETVDELTTSDDLPIRGAVSVPADTPVEIKSAAAAVTQTRRAGRWHIRHDQHGRLDDDGGVYLLTVREPNPRGDVVAWSLATPSVVEDLLGTWVDPGGGRTDDYAQLAWTNVFDPESVR